MCQAVLHGNVLFSVRHKNNKKHLPNSFMSLGNDGSPPHHPIPHPHPFSCAVVTVPEIERKWCGSKVLQKFTQIKAAYFTHMENNVQELCFVCVIVRLWIYPV